VIKIAFLQYRAAFSKAQRVILS